MSIIDAIYWEREYKRLEQEKIEKENREKSQNEFNGKTPCNNCSMKDLCKYAFSIEFKDYNKELFNIEITCKKYNPIK